MVNSLLFRWEDSQALQHHCGFCDRPLSHPGARASCFGTHSEPCHRFHQAMFMRNRAHMCNYCSTIDEAHYKRHHELVHQLRSIYEISGELAWTVVPAEPGDTTRGRSSDSQAFANELTTSNLTLDDAPTSKRERKDAKCLVRAANRARVITQEEIRYMDSILHSAEGDANGEGTSPANQEEMQLIEEHLRYNANVYNSHSIRRDLRRFAKIPDVDVDFDDEMERVLDTLRITELVKRNFKNRGLQGKELKNFEILVETFKNAVVEDLVLVRKDMMEIRMRRAGYLRYINKTAYGIVEDRYTDKDWKTGERITSSSSESSGLTSLSEEVTSTVQMAVPEIPLSSLSSSSVSADRRHLQHVHTRISGDDGLGQKVIEPYHTPLLPLTPNIPLKKPMILQLKVVENKENGTPASMTSRGWHRRNVARQKPEQFVETTHEKLTRESQNPLRSAVFYEERSVVPPGLGKSKASMKSYVVRDAAVNSEDFPMLSPRVTAAASRSTRSDAPAVQSVATATIPLQGPECLITPRLDADGTHPVVSLKKAKKAQREAKRKAKKVADPEEMSSPTAMDEAGPHAFEHTCNNTSLDGSVATSVPQAMEEMSLKNFKPTLRELVDDTETTAHVGDSVKQKVSAELSMVLSFPSMPRTTRGKHDHWTRFSRIFIVDQLTSPLLQSFEGCSHGSSCPYESNGTSDCPFHEPHCPCVDPLLNQCYLMHPGKELCTSGPYNQAHGERVLALYEQHELTKGRVMLVDDDLVPYLMDLNSSPVKPGLASMPSRLLRKHTEFLDGYDRGPLMKLELEFERLFHKNVSSEHSLTPSTLREIQRQCSGPKAAVRLCYCHAEVPSTASDVAKEFGKDFVRCSYRKCEFGGVFHKRCVKKLGVDKVSRWYCTTCEKHMKALACKTLNVPYKDDAAINSGAEKQFASRVVGKLFAQPTGTMKRFRSLLHEFYTADSRGDLEVEDVD